MAGVFCTDVGTQATLVPARFHVSGRPKGGQLLEIVLSSSSGLSGDVLLLHALCWHCALPFGFKACRTSGRQSCGEEKHLSHPAHGPCLPSTQGAALEGGHTGNTPEEPLTYQELSNYDSKVQGEIQFADADFHLCYKIPPIRLTRPENEPTFTFSCILGEDLHLWSSSARHLEELRELLEAGVQGGV